MTKTKVMSLIPARAGSVGLKDKNIKKLNNKELFAYTINAAIKSEIMDYVYLSTDSEKYAEIGKKYGAIAYPLRAKEYAQSNSSSIDLISSVIDLYTDVKTIVLLQPTSPLRTEKHIKEAYEKYLACEGNVISFTKSDKSSQLIKSIDNDNVENYLDKEHYQRQQFEEYYPNGAIFIIDVEKFLKNPTLYPKGSKAYYMDKESSVDIDDIIDFKLAEIILETKEKNEY